jgi:hypothetical protein
VAGDGEGDHQAMPAVGTSGGTTVGRGEKRSCSPGKDAEQLEGSWRRGDGSGVWYRGGRQLEEVSSMERGDDDAGSSSEEWRRSAARDIRREATTEASLVDGVTPFQGSMDRAKAPERWGS